MAPVQDFCKAGLTKVLLHLEEPLCLKKEKNGKLPLELNDNLAQVDSHSPLKGLCQDSDLYIKMMNVKKIRLSVKYVAIGEALFLSANLRSSCCWMNQLCRLSPKLLVTAPSTKRAL